MSYPQLGFGQPFALRLRYFCHCGFGKQKHAGDRYCVLECGPDDFCGVDDAGFDKVDIFLARSVESEIAVTTYHARHDDTAVSGRIFRDLPGRRLERAFQDLNARLFVALASTFFFADGFDAPEQR